MTMSLNARGLFLLICVCLVMAWPPSAGAQKKHPDEVKGIKSINGDVETKIAFTNKSGKTIKVYWLNYEGKRELYQTLKDGEYYEQQTFVTHPWLITDADDNAWY